MKYSLLSLVLSFAATPCQSALQQPLLSGDDRPPTQSNAQPFDEAFDRRVGSLLDHFHVPGVSIAVVTNNETYAKGYGYAVFPSEQATPDTLYYVASTTKSFTAASLLQLIEASANDTTPLTLKTKLSDLIRDDFVLSDAHATAHVTLEDALSHRTGLPGHDSSYSGSNGSLSSFVRRLRHLPFAAELREKWQYNNMMFVAVSLAIETVTGRRLGDYMREHIWRPLGMRSTFLGLHEARAAPEPLARGHVWDVESRKFAYVPYVDEPVISGAGNMISNVRDYARYLRAMIFKDPAVLSAASYAELRTPRAFSVPGWGDHLNPWTGPEMYTLGWQMAVYHGHEIFLHGGSIDGFGSQMAYLPGLDGGVGFVAMANTVVTSNYVAFAAMFDVLDDIIGVPSERRIDWVQTFDAAMSAAQEQLKPAVARARLFPDAPEPGKELPLPVAIDSYAGTYHSDGYHSIHIDCVDLVDLPRRPHEGLGSEKVLYAQAREKIWRHDIIFEHVSGDYFMAWLDHHGHAYLGKRVVIARFEVDVAGRATRLGIDYEPALGRENLIWFDRVA